MSYNIWQLNRNVPAAVALIREQQPDILLLQELSPYMALEFKKQLANLYPGQELHFVYNPGIAQGIITHYPLTPLEGTPHAGRALKVRVETPDGPIQIWNVHLRQPFYWPRHASEIESLAHAASDVNEPLILGGDFNTTDQSEMYRELSQHLSNAHWEAGWGFGFSFPSSQHTFKGIGAVPMPIIRIDHLFHNDHLFVRKARTLSEDGGSDHLPIVAEFILVK
jgi:endonuclease/exonuclease/phosphatase (EEP) superfamily protein YafD